VPYAWAYVHGASSTCVPYAPYDGGHDGDDERDAWIGELCGDDGDGVHVSFYVHGGGGGDDGRHGGVFCGVLFCEPDVVWPLIVDVADGYDDEHDGAHGDDDVWREKHLSLTRPSRPIARWSGHVRGPRRRRRMQPLHDSSGKRQSQPLPMAEPHLHSAVVVHVVEWLA